MQKDQLPIRKLACHLKIYQPQLPYFHKKFKPPLRKVGVCRNLPVFHTIEARHYSFDVKLPIHMLEVKLKLIRTLQLINTYYT
ncbi:hypothetical protein SAMN05216232_2226 [Virgibacillus subterraneus]|uniref:Uncharacterized protein n=1 Tax=Virgibacillus subterraneus TaxID=621109 RepID=A0A1H9FJB4_9BACI|nr:hypothetical protein SAMN05216232_2226 [Virgibacillus subterraneus]